MPEQLSLDEVLNEKSQPAKEAPKEQPAEAAPETEAKEAPIAAEKPKYESTRQRAQAKEWEAQGRDPETGQFIKKEEIAAPVKEAAKEPVKEPELAKPVQEEMTAKEKAAFAKAADETRKRQALEARIRELEAKATPAEPAKTFWDDPEAALRKQNEDIQRAVLGSRLQTSETIARSRHQDFEEKVVIFSEIAQNTPGLAQQMLAAPDPAEFVYRTATNHKALQDAGGLDAMRQKIQTETAARVRAELEAELKTKADLLAKERAALPGSLSDAPSKGTNRPVWSGPPSLDDILKS